MDGARRHAVARGCHAGLLGKLCLPARRRVGRHLVGRLSALRRRARLLRGGLFRGPGRDSTARRNAVHHAPGRRLRRGRRGDPPRLRDEPRRAAS
jgi:hypothetical protein